MTAPAPRLEAVDVGYTYPGATPTQALEKIDLQVQDNEFVAGTAPTQAIVQQSRCLWCNVRYRIHLESRQLAPD